MPDNTQTYANAHTSAYSGGRAGGGVMSLYGDSIIELLDVGH